MSQSPWISIEDGFPIENQIVDIVCIDKRSASTIRSTGVRWDDKVEQGFRDGETTLHGQAVIITHWTPIYLPHEFEQVVPASLSPHETIKAQLQSDPELAHSWHCNIAMTCYDTISRYTGVDHKTMHAIGNQVATTFMNLCFNIKTSANPKGEE